MPLTSSNFHNRITLSQQEMCIISQSISRDFSPRLFGSRMGEQAKCRFTPQELLEISRQISRDYAPSRVSQQSRLVLLTVSPRRLHAYWHVTKRLLINALQRIDPPQPMTLRIFAQPDLPLQADSQSRTVSENQLEQQWFDTPINTTEGQQDVFLPESFSGNAPMHFSAALGKTDNQQHFTPLTYSNPTAVPLAIHPLQRVELSNAMVQFIMPTLTYASSVGKTASSQGRVLIHE